MAQQTLAIPERRAGDFWIFWTGQTISQIGSALTFVVSAISLALIKTSFNVVAGDVRPRTSLRRDILEGLRYVLAQPLIRTMALFSLLANLTVAVFYPQIVFYAKEVLFASDAQVSQFFTAVGVGAVIFMLSVGLLRKRLSYGSSRLARPCSKASVCWP